ncbi:MAG: GC-type dockerin domain-anchored protein [Phycisphaerales bacterium JB060]
MPSTTTAPMARPWKLFLAAGMALGLAAGAATATPECPPDIDGDGDLTIFDFLEFQNLFDAGDLQADFDGDGDLTIFDFLEFQNQFDAGCPVGGVMETELAATIVGGYPFSSHVDAYNTGTTVNIAIDPGLFPSVEGQTADVYVVANKSRAEWDGDPSLVDVRGSAQSVGFVAGTIQDNTFALDGSTTLAGPAGDDIAGIYDLVVDLDGDGMLGDGDLIDGRGDLGGFAIFKNLTELGPYATAPGLDYAVTWPGIVSSRNRQLTVYPENIADLPPLPLVVISHGNGHDYRWYDFLQQQLASHGFVVMANQNDTVPGIETASTTTYLHTDAFLGSLDTIGGGVLQGQIDTSRIMWIGHSRGGEGVARAFTRVRDGLVTTQNYDADDITLVSSIAPNNSLGAGSTEPGFVNFHLLWGSADGDISGAPSAGVSSFAIHDRAEGNRYSTYLHGADHNDFNCCGFNDFSGPAGTEIGREEAQRVQMAVYLVLAKLHAEESIGGRMATEYLWRQAESLESLSVSQSTTVVREYRETLDGDDFYIDDFQTNEAIDQSSSGGSVMLTVSNAAEVLQSDSDGSYSWTGSQPSNGMTRATGGDDSRGLVFDWASDSFIEFAILPSERDWTDDFFFSFRATQGTRHPQTVAELGDLTFTVSLRDTDGNTSSIQTGVYGGGVEEPYQRGGAGSGAGWQNEYETTRIRLDDFLVNGSGLDLSNIEAVRFDFGPSFGSAQGRLGLDDIYVNNNRAPLGIDFDIETVLPDIVAPGEAVTFEVEIKAKDGEALVGGSEVLRYRLSGGSFIDAPLVSLGDDLYEATVPAAACGDNPEFFLAAEGTVSGEVVFPPAGPDDAFSYQVANQTFIVDLDFETAVGWTVENIELTDGQWDRGVPAAGGRGDPFADFDGSGQCWVTDNVAGNSDVDGGPTILISPVYDLSATPDAQLSYARWFTNDDLDVDTMDVQVSNNGGLDWVTIESTGDAAGWVKKIWTIGDFVPVTSQMRFRFLATDNPNDSVTEAGLDAFQIFTVSCP